MKCPSSTVLMWVVGLCVGLSSIPARGQGSIPSEELLDRFNLVRVWWGNASFDSPREPILGITQGERNLYVQTAGGAMTAFHCETGRRLWSIRTGSSEHATERAVESGDLVFVINGMWVYAIQQKDGHIRWRMPLDGVASSRPAANEDSLYIVNEKGILSCYNLQRLEELDRLGRLERESGLALRWRYITTHPLRFPPMTLGSYVYLTGGDGTFYSLTANRHELNFRFESHFPLTAPVTMMEKGFLVATENFHLYSIDGNSGRIRWQYVSGPRITQAPRSIEKQIFVSPESAPMMCLDAATGDKLWSAQSECTFVAAGPERIYASDRFGNLLGISRKTGETTTTIPLKRFSIRMTNDVTDRIILATPDGTLLVLRDKDVPQTIQYRYPERQPLMPQFAPETPVREEGANSGDGDVKSAPKSEKKSEEEPAAEEKPAETEKPAEEPKDK